MPHLTFRRFDARTASRLEAFKMWPVTTACGTSSGPGSRAWPGEYPPFWLRSAPSPEEPGKTPPKKDAAARTEGAGPHHGAACELANERIVHGIDGALHRLIQSPKVSVAGALT